MIKIIYAIKIHLIFCFYSYIDNSRYSFCIGGIVWKRKTYFEVDIFNQCQKKKKIETTMWVLVYISTSNTMFFPGKALSSTVELEFSRP